LCWVAGGAGVAGVAGGAGVAGVAGGAERLHGQECC